MNLILVTGSSGFVGRAVCTELARRGLVFRPAVRGVGEGGAVCVGEIDADTNWRAALDGCDTVIHLAARVHMMRETATDPLAAFRRVNVEGTLNLARQAVAAGVRRFVFVSSLKVCGEVGGYTAAMVPAPADAYAQSKHEAEQGLHALAATSGLEIVVLRPPLVYGPGVGANFARLLRAVTRGLPLPLSSVANRRSLVYVGNLADAIVRCIKHPAAAGRTYLVGDDDDVSTPELIRRLAQVSGRPARLFPFPPGLLRLLAALLGRQSAAERVLGSLYIADTALRDELGWHPPFSLDEGLQMTVVAAQDETLRK